MRSACLLATLLAALAVPAHSQEFAVSRRSYTFFARDLIIEITADAPGALQVLRGQPGRLEIAAHARDGLAAWGLAGAERDRLQLSAIGAIDADYIVVAPEDVDIVVSLPGEAAARAVPWRDGSLFRWDEPARLARAATAAPEPAAELLVVHRGVASPARIDVPRAASLRRIEVRVEGDEFRVASSAPLAVGGATSPMVIRTGGERADLLITVPRSTRAFQLSSGSTVLARLANGRLTSACQPRILLEGAARQSLAIHPIEGPLRCE